MTCTAPARPGLISLTRYAHEHRLFGGLPVHATPRLWESVCLANTIDCEAMSLAQRIEALLRVGNQTLLAMLHEAAQTGYARLWIDLGNRRRESLGVKVVIRANGAILIMDALELESEL